MYQHATFREFEHYATGIPADALARRLRCTSSTVTAWLSGRRAPPWWAAELLRLQEMERLDMARQMGYSKVLPRLGLVRGQVIEMAQPRSRLAHVTKTVTEMPPPGVLRA
ncbi:hypothetical protein CF70_012960 [Cupriavidus sp. SK-3]|uniref:transcriptional regulator n=1 Tax=Cupriavidus sp. SK-3 TaxID=1470558 RepID=UPI00044E911A|nr:transcriptional regulator [Cupriavidus sp. SK-3]KDP85606.1 hypothetical protein CF70_012960 [Cupriavidus sp. SK-3]